MSEEETQVPMAPQGGLRLAPLSWGAGILFGAFLCAIRFIRFDTASQQEALFAVLLSIAVGGVIAAAALLGFSLFSQNAKRHNRIVIAVGVCLCFAGLVGLASLCGFAPSLPLAALRLQSAGFGVGAFALAVQWGAVYGRMEPESLLPNGAASLVVASFVHGLQNAAGPTVGGLGIIAAAVVASAVLLWVSLARASLFSEEVSLSEGAATSRDRLAMLKSIGGALWMPVVGACLSCFIFGLIWDPIVSEEQAKQVLPGNLLASMSGPVLMAAAVAVVVLRNRGTSPLRFFNQAVFPLAVALLLVIPVISENLPALQPVTSVLSSASFAVVGLSVWCSMASLCRTLPAAPSLVFSGAFVLFGICFVAGAFAILDLGTMGRALCLVLFAFYLALIALYFARSSKEERENRTEPPAETDTRSFIHRRCEELAEEYGISPREKEVLFYLGRGYNHGYIAKKLFVSENTVRTHVRHIYGKLGVSSREELLDLIDENELS